MRKWTMAAAVGVAGLALGALAASGRAQEDLARGFGSHKSFLADETYDLSVGLTSAGRPRLPEIYRETRQHVVVPSHYGELFLITQDGRDAVLWFRCADGSVRNVVVDSVSSVPYQIERSETIKLEVKTR